MRIPSWESSPGALADLLSNGRVRGPVDWYSSTTDELGGVVVSPVVWYGTGNQPVSWIGSTPEFAHTQLVMQDLYTITLANTTVLRYTSGEVPVTVDGKTFGVGPLLQRSRISTKIGVEVDHLSLTLSADSSVTVGGVPMMKWISKGGLLNARVRLERPRFTVPPQTHRRLLERRLVI